MKISKFMEAAEIYESVGYFKEAIDAFVACEKFDRALDCAD